MAAKKKSASKTFKRSSAKKSSGSKSSRKTVLGHGVRRNHSAMGLTIHDADGRVYIFTKTGVKRASRHVAKKASAREIRVNIGLSGKQASNAKSLLTKLENEGLIAKY